MSKVQNKNLKSHSYQQYLFFHSVAGKSMFSPRTKNIVLHFLFLRELIKRSWITIHHKETKTSWLTSPPNTFRSSSSSPSCNRSKISRIPVEDTSTQSQDSRSIRSNRRKIYLARKTIQTKNIQQDGNTNSTVVET